MDYFTTSLAVASGVCLAFGVLYLFIGLRRTNERRSNLLFALFALAYAGAVLTSRSGYLATDTVDHLLADRVTAGFAAAGLSLLVWYVSAYTGLRARAVAVTITGVFIAAGLASVFAPDLLFDPSRRVSQTTLPWGETILLAEEDDAVLLPLVLLAQLALIGYITTAVVRQYRRGERRAAALLGVGVGWFVGTLVVDILVSADVIDFVFLTDLGFLGFVAAMSLGAADRTIATERELLDLRSDLEAKVEDRTAHLRQAQAQLVAQTAEQAAEQERSRLARELHDVVTQLLFSINLIAGSLGRLWRSDPDTAARTTDELRRLTRGALAEMRVLLRELRPQAIAETDLVTLLTQLSHGVGARHDIPVDVRVDLRRELPRDVHVAFYRIAQEAMNNVAKHADASSVFIELDGDGNEARLAVTDDGVGFDADGAPAGRMGLGIMRERADGIGADLAVVTAPANGTSVEVTWAPRDRAEVP